MAFEEFLTRAWWKTETGPCEPHLAFSDARRPSLSLSSLLYALPMAGLLCLHTVDTWDGYILAVGVALCVVGCSAASLASAQYMPVASLPFSM